MSISKMSFYDCFSGSRDGIWGFSLKMCRVKNQTVLADIKI